MKPVSSALANHLAQEVTTLATCWRLRRKDGAVFGFTDHDRDIVFEEVTYSASSGFTPSAVANNADLAVDHLDIEGVLDSAVIREEDVQAGLYDFAEIEVFMLNYADVSQGAMSLRTGWLGEVHYTRNRFVAEVRGLMQSLSQVIGDLYSPSCRAQFGDAKCGVDLEDYTVTGTITSITNNRVFSDTTRAESPGYFSQGKITFTSGDNEGLSMEVKEFIGGQISLVFPMPYAVQVGDEYTLIAGCDKRFETCIAAFNNAVNFRGEPHIPGMDKMLQTAGTR